MFHKVTYNRKSYIMLSFDMKKVLNVYISSKEKVTTSINEIVLNTKGVVGDKFYDKNKQRSILISSTHSYKMTQANKINIQYGDLGENILVNFNPYNLSNDTKLKIGNVILQITQKAPICNHLSKLDKKLPFLLKDDRGIFAKVIKGGTININDSIEVI